LDPAGPISGPIPAKSGARIPYLQRENKKNKNKNKKKKNLVVADTRRRAMSS
jgi:hypothetical protein